MKTKVISEYFSETIYQHTCGEDIIVCETSSKQLIYKSISGTIIIVCPGCLRDLILEDLNKHEPWLD